MITLPNNISIHPQFITDSNGNKISVVISVLEFKSILEELEDMEDIRLYDEAKKSNEPSVPIDDAFKMIEAKRKAN